MAAEVGSVYIRVKAITDKVAPDIQKAFSSINAGAVAAAGEKVANDFSKALDTKVTSGASNAFMRAGKALSDFGGEAGSARNKFYDLTATSYIAGTAITTVLGAVSSLIGGFASLAGAIGGALPAMAGAIGAFVDLRVGIAVADLALQGIMQAVQKSISQQQSYAMTLAQSAKQTRDLAFAHEDAIHSVNRANLNFEKARVNLLRTQDLPASSFARRQALQEFSDAELALREAKQKVKDTKAEMNDPRIFKKTADPFAGLTDSQREFAKYLVSIQGDLKSLTEAAASGFLPILKTNIQELNTKLFPVLRAGLHEIGLGLGEATTNIKKAILDPSNLKELSLVMSDIAKNMPAIGTIIGNIYGTFLTILHASNPLIVKFLDFLKTKTTSFTEWLKAKEASGELQAFFDRADTIMGDLYKIFENTIGYFGGLIKANFGPGSGGDTMIQWLKKVTGGWAELGNTREGMKQLREYSAATSLNATHILDSFGALVGVFLQLGKNQNIGLTFDNLAKGAPAIGKIGEKLINAGPALGKFIADLTIFINKLTDTSAIVNFFNVLDGLVQTFSKLFDIPAVKVFFDILGQIHGVMTALVVGSTALGFAMKIVGENIRAISTEWKFFSGIFSKMGGGAGALLTNPWVIAIAAIVVAMKLLYDNSKEFRDFVDTAFKQVGQIFADAWKTITDAFKPVISAWNELMDTMGIGKNTGGDDFLVIAFKAIIKVIQDLIVVLVPLASFLAGIFATALKGVIEIFSGAFKIINGVIDLFKALWKAIKTGNWDEFSKAGLKAFNTIKQGAGQILAGVVNIFIDAINNVIQTANDIGKNIKTITGGIINPGTVPKIPRWTPKFAQGGTVMPSPGGSLVNVAEAGKPERIEPLDANGLSNRDKAMIDFLTKGSGGARPVQLNVYPSAGMDEQELAAIVSRTLAFELRKGGI